MDAPFQATHQTKRMLYEMMLCAEHRGAYVGYVRGEFSRTLTSASARIPRGRTRHMPRGVPRRASSRTACASSDGWPEKVHPCVVSPLVFGLGGPAKGGSFIFSRAMSVNVRTDLVKQ